MYTSYFGLDENPFSITPDPRYLYMSARHREALAHLFYGLGTNGGFVQLTGEIGAGKTTICRSLLRTLPDNVDVALILNPALSVRELLATICHELGIGGLGENASTKDLVDALNGHLLGAHARGRKTVLIIDEAQNLSMDVLEQIRLLTNLETERHKLLQVFLIGQPELRELLGHQRLRQLAQRVTARFHLEPLTRKETEAYVRHRLAVAGADVPLFTAGAIARIYRLSKGVPRTVNILCDRALLGAFVTGREQVTRAVVAGAAREIAGDVAPARTGPPRWAAAAAVLALAVAGTGALVGWWTQVTRFDAIADEPSVPVGPASPAPDAGAEPEPGTAKPSEARAPGPAEQPLANLAAAAIARRAVAERRLLERWDRDGRRSEGDAPLCNAATRAGLRCLHGWGTMADLERLNRPALLTLWTEAGARFHAVAVELGPETITLDLDGGERRYPRAEIERYWRGEYLMLWRPPLEGVRLIRRGSPPDAVAWLRETLARVQEVPPPAEQVHDYDWPLLKSVMRFQERSGVEVDGVVGTTTFIALNTAMRAPGIPTLTDRRIN